MSETDSQVIEKTKLKQPSLWTVILFNDDFTPMEFVVYILQTVFHIGIEEAHFIMLTVHNEGKAPVGRYTKDIACTKAKQVCEMAEMAEHPLKAVAEEI